MDVSAEHYCVTVKLTFGLLDMKCLNVIIISHLAFVHIMTLE